MQVLKETSHSQNCIRSFFSLWRMVPVILLKFQGICLKPMQLARSEKVREGVKGT